MSLWLGSGLIVSSTSKFAQKLRLSAFAFSFVFLGLLTSIPEFSVGLQSIADHDPEIFIGNLVGGIMVLFFLIIPLLAIFGNGINLKHEFDNTALLFSIGVILTPSLFLLDKKVTILEGFILIILYILLIYIVERKKGIFNRKNSQLFNIKSYSYKDILKIFTGIAIVFISSSVIVDKTIYFAAQFDISAFYISLIVIAIGTDLPEITLAIRSVFSGKKDIAMGDYFGAGVASTLLFGLFTILNGGEIITVNNFLITFLFITIAFGLFYFLTHSRNYISRNDGFFLLGTYILFIILELI